MRATEGGKTFCEPLGHVLDGSRRSRCDVRQARRDRQQVFDAMAHLPCEQLMALFGLLTPGIRKAAAERMLVKIYGPSSEGEKRYSPGSPNGARHTHPRTPQTDRARPEWVIAINRNS